MVDSIEQFKELLGQQGAPGVEELPPPPAAEELTIPPPEELPAEQQDPPPPPAPPTWEDFSGGKVKSAEEFQQLYDLAKGFKDNPEAVKVAQMWMSGEGIGDLLEMHNTNFDNMNGEDVLYRAWASENKEIANDPDLTPAELRDEFMEYIESKYPGYNPSEENNGLGAVKNKKMIADIEALRSGFNSSKKEALALKLEKRAETPSETKEDGVAPVTPEQFEAMMKGRRKEIEDFKTLELAEINGEKVSIPIPEGYKAVATAIAKDPVSAIDARYFPTSEDGKELPFDHMKLQRDLFILEHPDVIAKYYYDLGRGSSAEEQAIALGQKKAPEQTEQAAGGEFEQFMNEWKSGKK